MNGGLPRKVLVIGGSGAMGSRVINHVGRDAAGETCTFRVLTRNPDTRACRELGQRLGNRVEFARGSVSDALHVQQALCGIDTVFANTSYWSYFQQAQGGEAVDAARVGRSHRQALSSEIRDGVMLLEAARREGVRHFVYSSLDAMDRPSGGRCPAPHFDAKAEVEAFITSQRSSCGWYRECVSVLVTAPYMENFLSSRMFRHGAETAAVHLDRSGPESVLRLRVPVGEALWPMATLDDIGWFAAHMLLQPRTWAGRTLAITSDQLSMHEIAATFERVTGIRCVYEPYTPEQYAALGFVEASAIAAMFDFIRQFGIQRDMAQLLRLKPDLCSFEQWLRESGWSGEVRTVQKDLEV